jgi:hypothetical protein
LTKSPSDSKILLKGGMSGVAQRRKGEFMKKPLLYIIAGLMLAGIAAEPGIAAENSGFGYRSWGLRGGLSVSPDQIFVGAQMDLGEFVPALRFKPNATVGLGDHWTLISINPDVTYAFPVEDLGKVYAGGILAFEWIKLDLPPGSLIDDSGTDVGVHVVGGLEFQTMPVFVELNIGLSDEVPDLKAAVGYNFE